MTLRGFNCIYIILAPSGTAFSIGRWLFVRCQFHQQFTSSFYSCRSKKRKNSHVTSSFYTFGIFSHKKAAHKTLVKLTKGFWFPLSLRPHRQTPRCRFHQLFYARFFHTKDFFLVTFWQTKHFRTKNACIEHWWNWLKVSIIPKRRMNCRNS